MTIDQARIEAGNRWCNPPLSKPCVWITNSGRRAVGYTDGEFRYTLGIGETWEEALANAERTEWRKKKP